MAYVGIHILLWAMQTEILHHPTHLTSAEVTDRAKQHKLQVLEDGEGNQLGFGETHKIIQSSDHRRVPRQCW